MSVRLRISVFRLRQLAATSRFYGVAHLGQKRLELEVAAGRKKRRQPPESVRELAPSARLLAELCPVSGRRKVAETRNEPVFAEPSGIVQRRRGGEELVALEVSLHPPKS
jgi:hypothetical protein